MPISKLQGCSAARLFSSMILIGLCTSLSGKADETFIADGTPIENDENQSKLTAPVKAKPNEKPAPLHKIENQPELIPAGGASPKEKRAAAKLINNEAYRQTKTATKLADYQQIIKLCDKGLEKGVDAKTTKYAARLMSWSHNRIGEEIARKAIAETDHRAAKLLSEQAMAEFKTAIRLDESRWRAVHNRAVSLAEIGDYRVAIVEFDRAIGLIEKQNAQYIKAYFNRGVVRYQLASYREAIADFDHVLKQRPRDSASYNSRGHAHYRLDQIDAALKDFNLAIHFDPNNAEAYINRGDIYYELAHYRRAAMDYVQAAKLDPQSSRAVKSAAWMMATCPEAGFRDGQRAVLAAQQAIQLAGATNYELLDVLAAAQASAGQFDLAQASIAAALKVAPRREWAGLRSRSKLYQQKRPLRAVANNTTTKNIAEKITTKAQR